MEAERVQLNRLKQNFIRRYGGTRKTSGKRLKDEVEILSLIAAFYLAEGEADAMNNWPQLLKAHALYNSCAVRSSGHIKKEFERKVCQIQNRYQREQGYPQVTEEELASMRSSQLILLQEIRDDVRSAIKPLRARVRRMKSEAAVNQFCKDMEIVGKACNDAMVRFAKNLMKDAIALTGNSPPCSFAAIAKGSLARGEATPYSDLEFFFIIAVKTPATKEYFMHLAMNMYFLIGNLQETNLRYMNIKELQDRDNPDDKMRCWFEDLQTNGMKIDGLQRGAGNIPTGNGVTDRKNKYINSPEELLEKFKFVFDSPNPEDAIRGDDSAMLAFTKQIYAYQEPSNSTNHLLDNFVQKQKEYPMNKARQEVTKYMLTNDIHEYELDVTSFASDHTVEVKSEIYRFVSLVILDLCILYKLYPGSSWDALEDLFRGGYISYSFRVGLHNLLAMASYVRMCTYLYHRSQIESLVLPKPPLSGRFKVGKPCYLVSGRIFKHIIVYMYSMAGNTVPVEELKRELRLLHTEGSNIADRMMS